MPMTREELHNALVVSGAITEEQFEQSALQKEAGVFGLEESLLARGILKDDDLGQILASHYDVPFIQLARTELHPEVVGLLPEVFAREQQVLVVSNTGTKVRIATTDPNRPNLKAVLEKRFRQGVDFSYATVRDLRQHYYLYQADPEARLKGIIDQEKPVEGGMDTRVTDLVDAMMDIAYQRRVSDIHLDPEEDYLLLRFREDGILHDVMRLPPELHENIVTRIKVMSRLATDEHRKAQDGKISYTTPWGNPVEIRVSIVPTTHQEKVVMRLLTDQTQAFSLPELGFSTRDYAQVVEAAHKPWGMILVTGPTGSGKTTTLYAVLQLLNEREVNITTIEDPVEVDLDGVAQIQVNEKAGLTFAKGLRSIVRQDPDVIMVGEIRDPDTASIAVDAAMTGHLVLSTLHTNDAATAFVRLMDLEVKEFLIASTVNLVIAQRLVRKICMNCIQSSKFDEAHKALLDRAPEVEALMLKTAGKKATKDLQLYVGKGCKVCHGTGYHGRIGIFETLEVTEEIRNAFMAKMNSDQIGEIARGQGMTTMVEDGLQKVLVGQTTIEEVLRVSQLED